MKDPDKTFLLAVRINVPGVTTAEEALDALTSPDGKTLSIPREDANASGIVWRSGQGTIQN